MLGQNGAPTTEVKHLELDNFLTLVGEEAILAKRKHWFVLVVPIFFVLLLLFIFGSTFLTLPLLVSPLFPYWIILSGLIFIFTVSFSLITKIIVDWYCHFYIVTTKKILEVCHTPLSSSKVNEVLLDRVRCTEVDVKVNGIVNEIIEKGDVIVTFDRPTHQEEFILQDVKDPRSIGLFLSDIFEIDGQARENTSWYKGRGENEEMNKYKMREEIYQVH